MSTSDVGSAPEADLVAEAMNNADKSLISEQLVLFERLLRKQTSVFAASRTDQWRTSLMYHRIDIGDRDKICQPMHRVPHEQSLVLKAEVDNLQKAGDVVHSKSPFVSLTILVTKKKRFNAPLYRLSKTEHSYKIKAHPLSCIENIFDTLTVSKFFFNLDFAKRYHQVEVHPDDC